MVNVSFRFIDLFAGVGGMRIPFERDLGGTCVFTSEKDVSARLTYSRYFGVPEHEIDRDISVLAETAPVQIPDHDLLLAGFPCQPFSHAGKRGGFEDTRGTLFFSIASILKQKTPRVVLLENVRGLKTHDHGRTFRVICDTLVELEYVVHAKVLNARDFGLPQNRNRLFIVAIRADVSGSFNYEFPSPTHDRDSLSVSSILDDEVSPTLTLSDRLWQGHQARKIRNESAGKGFGYQLVDPHSPYTATISARYYKDGSEILLSQADKNPRMLSPREAARLQGFPEDFEPDPSAKQAYKQFGNAVPVAVISALAKSLRWALHG